MYAFNRLITAVLAGSCMMATASASLAETFIVTSNVPPAHWANVQGVEPWMACAKERTAGEVDFKFFPGGQIANHLASLDAVNKGLAQVSYVVISALSDKMPLNGISMLPDMGDTVVEMTNANRKVLDGNGPIAREFSQNRIVPLMINMYPAYQILHDGPALHKISDFAGKKVVTGGGAQTFTVRSVGATAIEMGAGDTYLALQQGTAEGALLSTSSIKPYKLDEQVKSISSNGAFGSASGVLSIDSRAWTALSDKNKKALHDCGIQVENALAKWLDQLTIDLQKGFTSTGIDVYAFTPEEKAEIGKRLAAAREDYIARIAARGLPAQEAYKEYLTALGR